MPRGKYTNHKGRSRRFTSAEELEEQRKKDEYRQKKKERGMESSEDDEEEEAEAGSGSDAESGSEESGEEGEDAHKKKGVASLIEISNPNRAPPKAKKVTAVTEDAKPELSRREREEIEKQRASAHYHMLHAQGKTAQARADLARLAIIKQQREEAAKRREAEKQEREAAKQNKTALTQKALGKKT